MRPTRALAVAFVLSSVALAAQTPATVDYDTFFKLNSQGRIRTFNQVTPENRAALVREHIERWVEGNRARLTTQQLEVLRAWVEFYRTPMTAQRRKEMDDSDTRTLAVFSRAEVMQAMTIHGDYIPKKPTN
jgi:hypothetical protein